MILKRAFGRGFAQMHADIQEIGSKSQVAFLMNTKLQLYFLVYQRKSAFICVQLPFLG
jgi:hypothetical protein